MSKELHINTILAQAGIKSDEATGALVTPLHFSTTYQHPEFGQSTGFDYTRTKNPTRSKAEEVLAAIESADYALATSSGMSAIVLAFSVFPVGSKVLAVRDLYGGSFRWFNQVEQEGRFHFTYANTEEELIAELEKDVDVLYIETPTNPLMLEFDIEKLAKLAHAKGAKVVVDLSLIHILGIVNENLGTIFLSENFHTTRNTGCCDSFFDVLKTCSQTETGKSSSDCIFLVEVANQLNIIITSEFPSC